MRRPTRPLTSLTLASLLASAGCLEPTNRGLVAGEAEVDVGQAGLDGSADDADAGAADAVVLDAALDQAADVAPDEGSDAGSDTLALDVARPPLLDAQTPDGGGDVAGPPDVAPDVAATDAPAVAGCCFDDSECAAGHVCTAAPIGLVGRRAWQGYCVLHPGPGRCFHAEHCGDGEVCVGPASTTCTQDAIEIQAGQCGPGPPPGTACCAATVGCPAGERCVSAGAPGLGSCKGQPPLGACWDDLDCAPVETCQGAAICPCDADCDMVDTPGTCDGPVNACCTGTGLCPEDQVCVTDVVVAAPICMPPAPPGHCWRDQDCLAGQTCHGAAACGCNADCDMGYEGPGVCVVPAPPCTAVEEAWVLEICDAASVVLFDGASCVRTCFGCCGCEPFCDLLFSSLYECAQACGPSASDCQVWDGSCDDAIPESPWWYFDGTGCYQEDSCVCGGCQGTFPTLAACDAACGW